jgi:hypothetical protein
MAGGTDNNQLKLAAKTRCWWRQQFVDDDKDKMTMTNMTNTTATTTRTTNTTSMMTMNTTTMIMTMMTTMTMTTMTTMTTNTTTVTATAVGDNDNGGNSNARGHRQQSTKIGSKNMVAVAAAIH